MAKRLTKKGAQAVVADLDKLATLFEHDYEILGMEKRIAHDMARRCDMVSDHLEQHADKVALSGDDVVKEQGFDPDDIGREKAGPLVDEPDEPYMDGQFTQQENRELREKQEDGELGPDRVTTEPQAPRPGVQASLGILAAAIGDGNLSEEASDKVAKALSLATKVVREAKEMPPEFKEQQEKMKEKAEEKKEDKKDEKEGGKKAADHGYNLTAE